MAKLDKMPQKEIVLGLKGILDFACWKGIYYVRRWPRYTGYNNRPSVIAGNAPFGYIKQQAKAIDSSTTAALTEMVHYTQRVYTDEQVSLYYHYDIGFQVPVCFPVAFERTAFDNCAFA